MIFDVLKGDVFKFTLTLRTLERIYFQIHPFTMSASTGQSAVRHQMGLDFVEVEFFIDTYKPVRHAGYYSIKGKLVDLKALLARGATAYF